MARIEREIEKRMEAACEKNGWGVAVAMMPPETTTLHIEKFGEKPIAGEDAQAAGFTERSSGAGLLNSANVVITFGLSFGKSDTSWWRQLWNRVFSSGAYAQLIVCPYSLKLPVQILGNRMVRIYAEEKKKVFHSFAGKNENVQLEGAMADRIIVLQPLHDEQNPYDYFHLSNLKQKYTGGENS